MYKYWYICVLEHTYTDIIIQMKLNFMRHRVSFEQRSLTERHLFQKEALLFLLFFLFR